jgi:hypothetical protein
MNRSFARLALLAGATLMAAGAPAHADKIKHPTAVFAGLDKITGRIISFEAAIGETVQFGSLQITARVCYSRPPTEAPQTDAFTEVDEVLENQTTNRIFTGWMFADSPGMHGVEHPVYDIWLTDCKGDGELIHEAPPVAEAPDDSGDLDLAPLNLPQPGKPGAVATPNPTATPKKRKGAVADPGPLDLNAPGAPVTIPQLPPAVTSSPLPAPRNAPNQRFYPTNDDAPIPPADFGR